jgi:hypothetical protein
MRKISKYARRMRQQPDRALINGAEWINTIQRCRSYTEERIPGSWLPDGGATLDAAQTTALKVRSAYDSLRNGLVPPGDHEPNDLLAHAMGVSWLRAIEIAGEDPSQNPMLPILRSGTEAVRRMGERRRAIGKWGLDGEGIKALVDAIDVYEEILMNSSPAQMVLATDARWRIIQKQTASQQLRPTDPNKE